MQMPGVMFCRFPSLSTFDLVYGVSLKPQLTDLLAGLSSKPQDSSSVSCAGIAGA